MNKLINSGPAKYKPLQIKRCTKYGNNYWETYSPKINRNVKLFSDLEYDNWLYVETNPDIISFCEQPLKIQVNIDGKIKESIFDMWILYKDNTEEFIEVKYYSEVTGTSKRAIRSQNQIAAQRKWCEENNYKYCVKTDLEIRKNLHYLNTLKYVISEVKRCKDINYLDCKIILELLKDRCLSISSIIKKSKLGPYYVMKIICYLIYTGSIKIINPDIDFSFDTMVMCYG